MFRPFVVFSTLVLLIPGAVSCYGLGLFDDAVVVEPFAPIGSYAGHWGVDVASKVGNDVFAIGHGTVSFAGTVAGRLSVTIDHGGGLRTSYSYLAGTVVSKGDTVKRGAVVGSSGIHGGRDAFHLSLRSGSTYLNPLVLGWCSAIPEPALWLAEAASG